MRHRREVFTCQRCRRLKKRCDRAKPHCSGCVRAGIPCSFDGSSINNDVESPVARSPSRALPRESTSRSSQSDGEATDLERCHFQANGDLLGAGGSLDSGTTLTTTAKAASGRPATIRRRERALVSCLRCHRLKVKCNKHQPCSRCLKGGFQTDCIYVNRAQSTVRDARPPPLPTPFATAWEDGRDSIIGTWQSKHRGQTHWLGVLAQINSLTKQNIDHIDHHVLAAGELERDGQSLAQSLLPPHFPFLGTSSHRYESLDALHAAIPARATADKLVDNYMRVFEKANRILHYPSFRAEVESYWRDAMGTVDGAWMAQFCMILGLGSLASPTSTMPEDQKGEMAVKLFDAAGWCLQRTHYLYRPPIAAMRALCLIITAKSVTNTTCWAMDTCWLLTGLVTRLAISMGYHRDSPDDPQAPFTAFEREMRRRLWTAVVYLDLQMSLTSGLPLLQLDGILADAPANVDDVDISPDSDGQPIVSRMFQYTDSSPQVLLHRSFPVISNMVRQLNSPVKTKELCYNDVLTHDCQIRAELRQVAELARNPDHRNSTAYISLDIFLRRALLVLHRRFALQPFAPTVFPVSYWTSLECSLALLVHHRTLCEDPSTGTSIIAGGWIMDFFAAMLTVCAYLLRADSPLRAPAAPASHGIPPRQTIIETLLHCAELWESLANTSLCFRCASRILDIVIKRILAMSPS